jgi:hypothetical protein
MYVDDSVPLRIPKSALADLRRLKAKKMQIEGRNVADAEIVAELVAFGRRNEDKFLEAPKIDFSKLIGTVSTRKGANATRDLDKLIYEGILDENRR